MSELVNKTALAEKLYNLDHFPTKKAAMDVVNDIFSIISEECAEGSTVRIGGFGTFKMKHKAARMAHNPTNREPVEVPAKDVLSFKVSKSSKPE